MRTARHNCSSRKGLFFVSARPRRARRSTAFAAGASWRTRSPPAPPALHAPARRRSEHMRWTVNDSSLLGRCHANRRPRWLTQSQWSPLVRLSTSDSTNPVPTIMLTALGSGTPRRQHWSCESRVCVEKWMLSFQNPLDLSTVHPSLPGLRVPRPTLGAVRRGRTNPLHHVGRSELAYAESVHDTFCFLAHMWPISQHAERPVRGIAH